MHSLLRRSDGFDHPIHRSGGEPRRNDPLRHLGVPRDPQQWIVSASAIPAFPDFQFGSLEFVTDQLGALRLGEEEAAPAAAEESAPPPKPHKLKRR